jgi:pyrimidine-specific ribonucleoside hydrolase
MKRKYWLAALWVSGFVAGAAWKNAVAHAHPNGGQPGDVLKGRPFVVLNGVPGDAASYGETAAQLVNLGIPQKFGQEEWASIVLTHEFHQHVGIYTIVGAKMGVKAREVLEAPMRSVQVTMECGTEQPMACVADGVQVALASTLAQNLITIPRTDAPCVSAVFRYKDKAVRLKLKPEYQDAINGWIGKAKKAHPGMTPEYFAAVEQSSYDAWVVFDRQDMFEITPL